MILSHKKIRCTRRIFLGLLLLLSSIGLFVVLPIQPKKSSDTLLGYTYSIYAAESLGLDAQTTFTEILQDLSPDIIRIPVYWDLIEGLEGTFSFDAYDQQLQALENTETKVILAIGHKLPRWPECHIPEWVDEENVDKALSSMIETTVERYKDHPNLYGWQVQNEVLFTFGECPKWSGSRRRLSSLIKQVKSLDSEHKVMTSDSGELSFWLRTSTLPIDALSISLYRAVYNPNHDYFYWPVNPYYYKLHALMVKPFVSEFIISELQMEPWGPTSVQELSLEEAYKSFNPYDFDDRIDFAQRTGATTILTWGVEWWYYMKEVQGVSDYWEKALYHFN